MTSVNPNFFFSNRANSSDIKIESNDSEEIPKVINEIKDNIIIDKSADLEANSVDAIASYNIASLRIKSTSENKNIVLINNINNRDSIQEPAAKQIEPEERVEHQWSGPCPKGSWLERFTYYNNQYMADRIEGWPYTNGYSSEFLAQTAACAALYASWRASFG